MDPNETLARLRHMVESHNGGAYRDEEAVANLAEMAEHVEALDEWLAKGGFLPDAWRSDDEKNAEVCGCGQPIVWIEDDHEGATGHWEHNVAEAYWGGDHDIDQNAPEGWTLLG